MNDPHVTALFYMIVHGEGVDYSKAEALTHHEAGFTIHIMEDKARVDLIDHFPSTDIARAAVEPFLRTWELAAALRYRRADEFEFQYERASVIDRKPTPGVVEGAFHAAGGSHVTFSGTVRRSRYPVAPVGLARDAAVDLMFDRYRRYREGKTTITDAGNYILTALEAYAGIARAPKRTGAAALFHVDKTVLSKLGELVGTKGGSEARKYAGSHVAFSKQERDWLDAAIPLMIRRAAERTFDATSVLPKITMADLPKL